MMGQRRNILFLYLLFVGNALHAQQEFYVSTKGQDTASGSFDHPLSTVNMAIRKVREQRRLNPGANTHYKIFLRGGRYELKEPVFIRPEDAGNLTSYTMVQSYGNEHAVISGGKQINKWTPAGSKSKRLQAKISSKVWVADLSGMGFSRDGIRQLWVNGKKAIRAKDTEGDQMNRIISWNKMERSCWVPTGMLNTIKNPEGLEMFIHQWWAIANLRVASMMVKGDSTKLFFKDPESRIQSEHPWPAPWISKETGNSAFYMVNAIELLDEPGEWFHDTKNEQLFYYPAAGVNMASADVVAPVLETLLDIQGNVENPVQYIQFSNLEFSHSHWNRPSTHGHVPHQIGMYMTDAYRLQTPGIKANPGLDNQAWVGRPAAAVTLNHARGIYFEQNYFTHLASTGLDMHKGVGHVEVQRNLFMDIGGTGILAGIFSTPEQEIHLPYFPANKSEVPVGISITNNLVTDVSNEDWSCAGIGLGYLQQTQVRGNEVEEVSNSGISMGWGWNPEINPNFDNAIIGNYIHHFGKHNYDCGGIYTMGTQANGFVAENRVDSIYKAAYPHLPTHWFYLYTDQGTSGLTVKNNWTPAEKFLQNANGPDNVWQNNGPSGNDDIMAAAGLPNELKDFFRPYKFDRSASSQSINEARNEMIELVIPDGISFSTDSLKRFLNKYKMDSTAVYSWKNHHVVYTTVMDIAVLEGRLKNNFAGVEVRVYHDLFYQFDRRDCGEKIDEKNWKHYILTANLVEDKQMQQAYLDAHATQRKYWPEVSKGFCNAGFKQLQLFRNGRQLMLVISIPQGETLEALDPKTRLNNPRMDDWNARMKQYQEGIAGTAKNETWVFLTNENK
ncbi:MAG: hypothetical protein RJB31_976 [Bacteroidota bacterium]